MLERDAEGRALVAEIHNDAKVRTVKVRVRFSYDPPHGLSWRQEAGDLKSVEGSWSFSEEGEGRTKATYEMTVDLGRMLGMLIRRPLVGQRRGPLVESVPDKLKKDVEGA